MVKVNETELVMSEGNSPAELIKLAISNGSNLEQLEKLLAIRRNYEADEARKAYHVAMAEFKKNPPKIDKDRQVSFGNTKYAHASLGHVTELISTELSKHGLSAAWDIKQNGAVSVTCRITHIQGHSEETTITAPADTSGSKNAIQAVGSTITYLQRYSLLALCGLATFDQDDDGQAAGPVKEFIDEKQKGQILDFFAELNLSEKDKEGFFKFMKIAKLDEMPQASFQKALAALEAARKRKAGKK
jgi:hypothetical protein